MDRPEEMLRLAEAWVQKQTGFQEGWYIRASSKNTLMVKWRHPEFGNEFRLARLRIASNGEPQFVEDFRAHVDKLLSKPGGFEKEKRLFDTLASPAANKPWWFLGAEKSDSFLDKRGIDGFAKIIVTKGNESIKIPFQVKSTKLDARLFYKRHPGYVGVVSIIVVRREDSSEQLCGRMFSAIGETRAKMLKENISVKKMKQNITNCIYRGVA